MLGLTLSFKLDWGSIAKTASKKYQGLDSFYEVFLQRLLCISTNLSYDHVWNIVVMSGLVLLVATWNCWISYNNVYAGLLVFHLQLLLNPWLIVEM